jgi:hypothetical protein
VAAFEARDREVEIHEMAHLSAAGPDASGAPVYEYKVGPDGKSYKMGGHVNISVREDDSDPAVTVARMMRIQRAALAPATPSSQDQRVAAEASIKLAKALAKLAAKQSSGGRTPAAAGQAHR